MSDSPGSGGRRIRTIALVLVGSFMVGGAPVAFTTLPEHDGHTAPVCGLKLGTRLSDVAQAPTGAVSADQASALLFRAWQAMNCSEAGHVATQGAVQALFTDPWSSKFQLPTGCFTPDAAITGILPPPGETQPGEEVCNSRKDPGSFSSGVLPTIRESS